MMMTSNKIPNTTIHFLSFLCFFFFFLFFFSDSHDYKIKDFCDFFGQPSQFHTQKKNIFLVHFLSIDSIHTTPEQKKTRRTSRPPRLFLFDFFSTSWVHPFFPFLFFPLPFSLFFVFVFISNKVILVNPRSIRSKPILDCPFLSTFSSPSSSSPSSSSSSFHHAET